MVIRLFGGPSASSLVRHVQTDDHLDGEQILPTVHQAGWATSLRRSYYGSCLRQRSNCPNDGRPPSTPNSAKPKWLDSYGNVFRSSQLHELHFEGSPAST